ncbi:MAG: DNA polymerase III subunit epsilon [Pseudomonadota bacterium]
MREIVLDTETTGFDPAAGDRIVEIGAVEILNLVPTGRTYHQYVNPERDMPEEAFKVHGLSTQFLSDKPVFATIAQDFLQFVGGAKLVIHNAAFDMKFLNAELDLVGAQKLPWPQAVDTLAMAKRRFPGAQHSLDALCRRFGVDNSGRTKHGALLDSELLAEVYLELMGGRQPDFALSVDRGTDEERSKDGWRPPSRPAPLAARLTAAERDAHAAFVASLKGPTIWSHYGD